MNQKNETLCEVCDLNKATHIRKTRTTKNKLSVVADCLCEQCAANPAPDHYVRLMTRTELEVLADNSPVTRSLYAPQEAR